MTNIYFDEDVVVHCLCKYFFLEGGCVFAEVYQVSGNFARNA